MFCFCHVRKERGKWSYVHAHSGAQHPSELLNVHNWYLLIAVVFFINSVLKLSSFCFHYYIDV